MERGGGRERERERGERERERERERESEREREEKRRESHHNLLQLLLLSYRLEYGFTGLSPQLLLKCRLVRVAAHAMSLLLAVHLDYDTERR